METTIKLDKMKAGDLAILAVIFDNNHMPDESDQAFSALIALVGETEGPEIILATIKAVNEIRKM